VIGKRAVVVTKHYKVGVLLHAAAAIWEDDATMEAVIQNIKGRWPHATISGFSMNPDAATSHQ
jgi:hypothetical protein